MLNMNELLSKYVCVFGTKLLKTFFLIHGTAMKLQENRLMSTVTILSIAPIAPKTKMDNTWNWKRNND